MMIAAEIVEQVAVAGGELALTADSERIRAELPEDASALLYGLLAHKSEVIRLLRDNSSRTDIAHPTSSGRSTDGYVCEAKAAAALTQNFDRWLEDRCLFRDRHFGSIQALWQDFCAWAPKYEGVPCSQGVFERLLLDAGPIWFEQRSGDKCVHGLFLKEEAGQRTGA